MERFEYMRMKTELVPQAFIDEYQLHDNIYNGYVYMEIRRGMYRFPQARMLANKLLKKRLAPHGYYEVPHTPGLWRHQFRPVMFTLVVDDLGVKYVGREHAEHLMNAIEENYTVTKDWAGSLYCGISLKWNYAARHVDISMLKYVAKQLLKFEHDSSHPKQDSPHRAPEIK
jgi:hypothetical protein